MVGHNMIISKNHFHKDWQSKIRINFDQPFKKIKRNLYRDRKARRLAPAPIHPLRPIIRSPTIRYNRKQGLGRGFSLAEIRAAKMCPKYARSIGIAVDFRRRNKSFESILVNKDRLLQYVSRLVLFPSGDGKKIVGKSDGGRCVKEFTRVVNEKPIGRWKKGKLEKARIVGHEEEKFKAFVALRQERGRIRAAKNKRKKLMKSAVLE